MPSPAFYSDLPSLTWLITVSSLAIAALWTTRAIVQAARDTQTPAFDRLMIFLAGITHLIDTILGHVMHRDHHGQDDDDWPLM